LEFGFTKKSYSGDDPEFQNISLFSSKNTYGGVQARFNKIKAKNGQQMIPLYRLDMILVEQTRF